MTDELILYQTDRAAWIAQTAPKMAAVIDANSDAELIQNWSLMSRDFQTATWAHLSEVQRERIRRLRKEAA